MRNRKHADRRDRPQPANGTPISRREFFRGAGVAGVAALAPPLALAGETSAAALLQGTPEQIHLTWGEDPSRTICVSWASPRRQSIRA